MPDHPDKFSCKRCGRCCRVHVPVTDVDILRWSVQSRDDILMRLSERNRFIRPIVRGEEACCPFLAKRPGDDIYVCRIYRTRPQACIEFPHTPSHAGRMGCRGLEKTEHS